MRTCEVPPGKAPELLKFYEQNGLAIISRYAKLAGCWTKESGTLKPVTVRAAGGRLKAPGFLFTPCVVLVEPWQRRKALR